MHFIVLYTKPILEGFEKHAFCFMVAMATGMTKSTLLWHQIICNKILAWGRVTKFGGKRT